MATPPRTRTRVLELLSGGEAITSSELRDRLGWPCSSGNVWAVVKKLHTDRLIHIDSWKRSYGTRGAMGPRWKLGTGEDAPKPSNDRAADNRRYWHGLDPLLRQHRTQKYKGNINPFTGLYIHAINQTARPVRKARKRSKDGADKAATGGRRIERAGPITPRITSRDRNDRPGDDRLGNDHEFQAGDE